MVVAPLTEAAGMGLKVITIWSVTPAQVPAGSSVAIVIVIEPAAICAALGVNVLDRLFTFPKVPPAGDTDQSHSFWLLITPPIEPARVTTGEEAQTTWSGPASAKAKLPTDTASVLSILFPHGFAALTIIFPLLAVTVTFTVMEFVLAPAVTTQPALGKVQI